MKVVTQSRLRLVRLLTPLIGLALQVMVAAASGPDGGDRALEKRVQMFTREVRCLVCQNETLADSQADLAEDLRREIRAQMKAGKSDEQIKAFLTERYGDFVLYRPPLKATTVPLWFGPLILAAAGFWALYRSVNKSLVPSDSYVSNVRPTDDRRRRA